jgi:hypothetical protein
MISNRVPATPRQSVSKKMKKLHRESKSTLSLKKFARASTETDVRDNWFFNKTANFSNPPKGIGNTGKRQKSNKNKPADAVK